MYQFTNFPTNPKRDSIKVEVFHIDGKLHQIEFRNSDGGVICHIDILNHLDPTDMFTYIGEEIRDMMIYSRNQGYAEAQADIRKSLGIRKLG